MREHGRVVVNVAHGDVDERGVDEDTVAGLDRQADPVVGGVGHVDRILDGDLAGVRIDGEQAELVTAHQSVRDLRGLVLVARLHLQLGVEFLGTLVHHRAILVLQEARRTVVRVHQADAQRDTCRLPFPIVVRRLNTECYICGIFTDFLYQCERQILKKKKVPGERNLF